jgi:hypothetical protein
VLVIADFVLEGPLALHALQAAPVPFLVSNADRCVLDLLVPRRVINRKSVHPANNNIREEEEMASTESPQ